MEVDTTIVDENVRPIDQHPEPDHAYVSPDMAAAMAGETVEFIIESEVDESDVVLSDDDILSD